MYRIFNSIHKYPRALHRVRVRDPARARVHTRLHSARTCSSENVGVSSPFSPSLFASLSVSPFFSSPFFPPFLFPPRTVSIRPPADLLFPPRADSREPPVSYSGKNEVAYFLSLVTNRLPGFPGNETKILLVGQGAPRREK